MRQTEVRREADKGSGFPAIVLTFEDFLVGTDDTGGPIFAPYGFVPRLTHE